uniref:prostaglandin E synthase-like n=1 Tax=Myxine glutinosa TaxID=7769 RepID=UPI00358FE313
MEGFVNVWDLEQFRCFSFYAVLLLLKMIVLAVITGQVRLRKKAFANPEDAVRHGGVQYCRSDPLVERCLRAHRNDMENIYPFLFVGALYAMSGPLLWLARIHFITFTTARILHSVAYVLALPAPTRSASYLLAQAVSLSMILQLLVWYLW